MLALSSGGGIAAADRSPELAYRASVAAMKAHDFAGAIPDLRFAADNGVFLAQYYLARLYAVDGQPFTDHPAAFRRLRALVAANRSIDAYIDKRAPFVGDAERLLAIYYRLGLPEAGIAADAAMSKAHMEHAALRLGNTEAQFQLALIDLHTPDLVPRALDALDNLAETKHHAAAAAQIALVYNEGRLHDHTPVEALAYAMFAVKLAGGDDRIWIGDIYQSLYCQASPDDRIKAGQFTDELERSAFDVTDGDHQGAEIGRDSPRPQGVLNLGEAGTQRACGNGEAVPEPASLLPPLDRPAQEAAAPVAQPLVRGFNSLVGFIAPPMGAGLKDLETPSVGDDHGEPLGGTDDQPTQ